MTDNTRRPARVALLSALAGAALIVAPVVPGAIAAPVDKGDIAAVTQAYVERFYPLWLSHAQTAIAPHNKLVGPDRISAIYQAVVAINDDTLYASTPIDFTDGEKGSHGQPVTVVVPSSEGNEYTDLSYSVLNLDAYGNVFTPTPDIPSKPAGDEYAETTYELRPPGYSDPPAPGAVAVDLPYDFTILIFRIDKFSDTTDMTTEADAFRRALTVDGVPTGILHEAEFGGPFKVLSDELITKDPIRYLRELQVAVASPNTPPLDAQAQQDADAFDALFGVEGANVTPATRVAFAKGARAAHDALIANYLDNTDANNWIHFTNVGEWGDDVLDRASLNEYIQYGNSSATAAYYHAFVDGEGRALKGSNPAGYTLTLPADTPEAGRFWSVTAYTPEAIELIPNDADTYLVARYTPGLVKNNDGSVTIYISQTRPNGVPEANWLPVSDREFNIMLRVYGVVAGSDVANNTYVPPPIVRGRGNH